MKKLRENELAGRWWWYFIFFFFKRGTFLFSWQKKKPCWHLLFFLSLEARMDWGHRFEIYRYLALVRQKQYSLLSICHWCYSWATHGCWSDSLVQWFCLSGNQNFAPKKGQMVIKNKVVGCTQEKFLSWQQGSAPCFPLPPTPLVQAPWPSPRFPHSRVRQKWVKIIRDIYPVFTCKWKSSWFLKAVGNAALELPVAVFLCEVLALTHSAFPGGIPRSKRPTSLNYSGQRAQRFVFVFPISESVKL